MSLLYVVSESDNDAQFYALCAEKLTGREFALVAMKNRHGDGVHAVRTQIKYALRQARAAAHGAEPVAFLAAVDNDRAPHPENAAPPPAGTGLDRARLTAGERARESRLDWMGETADGVLGSDRQAWPLSVALAVPVEMIEAWIVRSRCALPPQPTPHFSRATSDRARQYYQPAEPPPQWKDLVEEEQVASGFANRQDFYLEVIRNLDADALAARSLSFRMFKEWLDDWPKTSPAVSAQP